VKVLLIGHSYIHLAPQAKLQVLTQVGEIELYLVVPERWPFHPQGLVTARVQDNAAFQYRPIPTFFAGSETRYFYRSLSLGISRIQPDIIHVEQGHDALSYFQVLLYKRLLAPQSKAIFFTWLNRWVKGRRWPFSYVARHNLRHTDHAIAGNHKAKELLRRRGYNGPITVLPLWGIAKEFGAHFQPNLRAQLNIKGFVVGYVGRFERKKGLLTLLEAVAKLQDVTLLLVGRGSLQAELESESERLGCAGQLVLVNTVPFADLPGYYRAMDAFVLPSLTTPGWIEQFGHVLVEAMACETPVIGSDSGEIPNVIGDAGLIFPEGNGEALADTILCLIRNENLRRDLGRRGRERVLQHYTHECIAEKTHRIYQQTLAQ